MTYNQRGYSLVEVIIALFLFTLIAGAVAMFSAYYLQTYSFSFEETQAVNLAQSALTTMVREIREARSGDDGAWTIVNASDNSFTFYSDVTNDGKSDRVRYFIDGTDLKKGVIQPTAVPVTYPAGNEAITVVSSFLDTSGGPLFTYYNGNWPTDQVNNPLVPANRQLTSRYVDIHIRISVNQGVGSQPFELTTGVSIRSLKNNL